MKENRATEFQKIMEGVFKNDSMDTLLTGMAKILGTPALVIDTGFRVLARSEGTEGLVTEISNGLFLDSGYVDVLRASYVFQNVYTHASFVQTLKVSNEEELVFSVIQTKQMELYVFLTVMAKGRAMPDTHATILDFCRILNVKLQIENPYSKIPINAPNYLLVDLLDGIIPENGNFEERLSHLKWIDKGPFHLLVIKPLHKGHTKRQYVPLLSELNQWISLSMCIAYKESLVIFLPHRTYLERFEARREEMRAIFERHSMRAAVGPVFMNLAKTSYYYHLTETVYAAGEHYGQSMTLCDDMYDNLMAYMLEMHYGVKEYLHPTILKLLEHDRDNNTQLFETLAVYLHHRENITDALKILNVQRSTLFYRIKKIKEVTGQNLEKLDEIIQLHFSLHLVKLYGKEFFLKED